jgi:hypothetical protein
MNRPVTLIQAAIIEIIIKKDFFRDMLFGCLTLVDETDRLCRNVVK